MRTREWVRLGVRRPDQQDWTVASRATDAALLRFVHDDGKGIVWFHVDEHAEQVMSLSTAVSSLGSRTSGRDARH